MQVALLTELPLRIFRIARAVKGKKKQANTHTKGDNQLQERALGKKYGPSEVGREGQKRKKHRQTHFNSGTATQCFLLLSWAVS